MQQHRYLRYFTNWFRLHLYSFIKTDSDDYIYITSWTDSEDYIDITSWTDSEDYIYITSWTDSEDYIYITSWTDSEKKSKCQSIVWYFVPEEIENVGEKAELLVEV